MTWLIERTEQYGKTYRQPWGVLGWGTIGEHYLVSFPSPMILVKTLGFSQMSWYLSFHLFSVQYLLYYNQSFLLKEASTCSDFPAHQVKTRHLAWTSGAARVPRLLSAFSLTTSFSPSAPEGLWSNPLFSWSVEQWFNMTLGATLKHNIE